MSDQFIAEIRIFSLPFAPRGWAWCNGQLLSISQNTALFSVLGVTYGGDGSTTFALPNLQGRVPLGVGTGPGLSSYDLGKSDGVAMVLLNQNQIPAHNHLIVADAGDLAEVTTPTGTTSLATSRDAYIYKQSAQNLTSLSPSTILPTGGHNAHNNFQPYLTLNYCIALSGIFPSRS